MRGRVFVDTNMLICAHDKDAREKHAAAARVLKEPWVDRTGVPSIQVLQEFYVNATRKISSPLPRAVARQPKARASTPGRSSTWSAQFTA